MYEEYLTFRSLTAAQRALEVFRREGFRAELTRTPAVLSTRGCGYGLRMNGVDLTRAALTLRLWGVYFEHGYRVSPGGRVEALAL